MTTTLTAGQSTSFIIDAFSSILVSSDNTATGTLAFTSLATTLRQSHTEGLSSKVYGPYGVPTSVTITVSAGAMRYTVQPLAPIQLTAAQIASPSADILQNTWNTFQLNVYPFTRYTSDGTQLVWQSDPMNAPWDVGGTYGAGTAGTQLQSLTAALQTPHPTAYKSSIADDGAGNLTWSLPAGLDLTQFGGDGALPSVTFGAGAGTTPTGTPTVGTLALASSPVGNAFAFRLDLTPSASPTGSNANIATFTWATAFAQKPFVFMFPAASSARTIVLQATSGASCVVPDAGVSVNGFQFLSGGTALGIFAYAWQFLVIGRPA